MTGFVLAAPPVGLTTRERARHVRRLLWSSHDLDPDRLAHCCMDDPAAFLLGTFSHVVRQFAARLP